MRDWASSEHKSVDQWDRNARSGPGHPWRTLPRGLQYAGTVCEWSVYKSVVYTIQYVDLIVMIYLPSNNSENYPYACTNVRLMYFSIPQEPVTVSQALVVLIARSTQQEHPMCGSWRMQGCVISVTGGAMRWQCLEPHSSSLTISSVNSLVSRWENVFVGLYNKLFFETLKNIISQNSQNF